MLLSHACRGQAGRSRRGKGALWRAEAKTQPATETQTATVAPLQFQAEESVRDGLARISGELIERALARIECPGRNRAEDLHQVRVTLKRLRALLRLARPVISGAFYRRENQRLKDVADRLSFFRDSTVSRQTLADLAATVSDARREEAFSVVWAGLAQRAPAPRLFNERRERALRAAAESLAAARQSFENMLVPAEDWPALGPGLQKVYSRARNGMLRALTYQTSEAFHEWRKQVKYLYYQLQMLGSIWPKRLRTMARQLKKLEDRLGKDHDLAVLEELLRAGCQQPDGRRSVKWVAACLVGQSKKLRREAAAIGKEVLREKPRKFVEKLGKQWAVWRSSIDS
jgi:CHAD domain-containing protein